MDRRQPKPAPALVVGEPGGEPPGLIFADPAVVVVVEMALGHGGVQARDDDREVGHFEQGPRLVGGEADPLDAVVEPAERLRVVTPLPPVRPGGLTAVGFLVAEVPAARGPVDVMVARHDRHVPARQVDRLGQRGEEVHDLIELARKAPLRQVPGDDHQVRPQVIVLRQVGQVVMQAAEQGVVCLVGGSQAVPAEQVVPAELHVRHVQHGQLLRLPAPGRTQAGRARPARAQAARAEQVRPRQR